MGIIDALRPGETIGGHYDRVSQLETELTKIETENLALRDRVEFHETITRLELAHEDEGWNRLVAESQLELSRDGLRRLSVLARLMTIKNPLIRRGVGVRGYYTFAQGVTIKGRDPVVNDVVQGLVADPDNDQVLFAQGSQLTLDRTLHCDGNLFVAALTHPRTGSVLYRTVPFDEIQETVRNPQDRADVWFYLRRHTVTNDDGSDVRTVTALHPALAHQPPDRPDTFRWRGVALPVQWDQPLLHVTRDRFDGDRFGIPEIYAALDWAQAYKTFLEDWQTYVKALARFAWRHVVPKSKAAAVKTTHATGRDKSDGTQRPAGATAIVGADGALEPIKHSGAHVSSESGRQLALQVATALDVPYTILTGDADNSNLATAKTLDRPFELAIMSRQRMWARVYRTLLGYGVEQAALKPGGKLRGKVSGREVRDEWGRRRVDWGDADITIDVDWPDLTEHDVKDVLEGIAKYAAGYMPFETTMRLVLTALGVDDVDELINRHADELKAELGRAATEPADPPDVMAEAVIELAAALAG